MKITPKPELLAPAGDFEKLRTAVHYGADAVYLGKSGLSLRAKSDNFDDETLLKAILHCRERGVRSYVTINIFPRNRDIPLIKDHLDLLREANPDGIILSDTGVLEMAGKYAPSVPVHISTQSNITNYKTARFYQGLGAKRLVLSRELSIPEIAEIRENVDLELECFVHGSVCISYSGRCYISAFLANRSGNRGECANSCRWNYTLMEMKRPGEYLPVYENDRGSYILSARDLCMIEHLDKLRDAGVNSFKIEGRMKGINYVAGVVKTYREAIDSLSAGGKFIVREEWMRELNMFSSRGYSTGLYFGADGENGYSHNDASSSGMSHTLVGVVEEIRDSRAAVLLSSRLDLGNRVEFLTAGRSEVFHSVEEILDQEGSSVDSARNGQVVLLRVPEGVRAGDILRRTVPSQATYQAKILTR